MSCNLKMASSENRFVRVALNASGSGDVVNIPIKDNFISKQTLESQFVGAMGLKYQINGNWLAVPVENGQYKIPDLELQYIVVTTGASSNIDTARQILNKPNLAKDVQRYFSPSTNFNPRAGYTKDTRGNITRKVARECWRSKKMFTKVVKVCFVDDIALPVTFSKHLSLFEAMFSHSSNDDEDILKTNLIQIWENSGEAACTTSTTTDITILSYTAKILSVPVTSKEFRWTGESLKSNIGQGRLYVMVKSSKNNNAEESENSLNDIPVLFENSACKSISIASHSLGQFSSSSRANSTSRQSASSSSSTSTSGQSALSSSSTSTSGQSASSSSSTSTSGQFASSASGSATTLPGQSVSSSNFSSSSSNATFPSSASNNESDLEDFMLVKPKRKMPLRRAALRFRQTLSLPYLHRQTSNEERPDREAGDACIESIDSEDEELQRVLDESLHEAVQKDSGHNICRSPELHYRSR